MPARFYLCLLHFVVVVVVVVVVTVVAVVVAAAAAAMSLIKNFEIVGFIPSESTSSNWCFVEGQM